MLRSSVRSMGDEVSSGDTDGVVLKVDESLPSPVVSIEAEVDYTSSIGVTSDISLEKFLERPILIMRETWALNTSFSTRLVPFNTFISDNRVNERIKNFAYITGTVHVKFLTTGTAFHFGKILAAYEPWAPVAESPSINQISVLPYVVIDPNTATGGTLQMPLILPYNAYNLHDGNNDFPISIHVRSLNNLTVIGDSNTPVEVTALCWMTDVKFIMPTYGPSIPSRTVNSMSEKDLPPEKLPTTDIIAKTPLSVTLGRYLKASQVILKNSLEMAALMGFSKPNVPMTETRMRNMQTASLSNVNLPDTSVKLTMDSKQEVFIDGVVAGCGTCDEMDFNTIVQKEMLIDQFDWGPDTESNTSLWRCAVTPCVGVPAVQGFQLTPMGQVANCFESWRGTMIYRIEIVGTPFHRGKLRVLYDPYHAYRNNEGYDEMNVAYSQIIDLSETRNYEFCVGWGTNFNYLPTTSCGLESFTTDSSTTDIEDIRTESNGYLTISVFSPMSVGLASVGSDGALAFVNVYARMSDDSSFGKPVEKFMRDKIMYKCFSELPSNVRSMALQLTENPGGNNIPGDKHIICINQVPEFHDSGELSGIHFGERVSSVRQLLKRYCLSNVIVGTRFASSGASLFKYTLSMSMLPLFRRFTTISPTAQTASSEFRMCRNTWLNWFYPSYLGHRGGSRWKFFSRADIGIMQYQESSNSSGNFFFEVSTPVFPAGSNAFVQARNILVESVSYENGGALSTPVLNPTLEVEVPYYSRYRFKLNNDLELTRPGLTGMERPGYFLYQNYFLGATGTNNLYLPVLQFFACADDFSLLYYKYAPCVQSVNTPNPVP